MKERTISIGQPVALQGVVTEPEHFRQDLPVILLLNSGVMHRVGACRLSVKLARALAGQGYLSVRFDASGLGDSELRSSERPALSPDVAVAETLEVMDHLQQARGVNRFILYGLCSGARTSFTTACIDDRVVGIAMIDPYCPKTFRYHWNYLKPRILSADRWQRLIRRMVPVFGFSSGKNIAPRANAGPSEFFEVPEFAAPPSRREVAGGLSKLAARAVRMYVCFTGGTSYYNYREQFTDSFSDVSLGRLLTLHYFPEANHIMTQAPVQRAVLQGIVSWAGAAEQRPLSETK